MGIAGAKLVVAVRRPDDDDSARYTEDGINVVALDRRGRGLHRARPERRLGSDRFSPPAPPARVVPLPLALLVVVLVGAAVAIAVLASS